MFISSSQPTSTEKTDNAASDVEKLLPNLLTVVDLMGLLGLEKLDNEEISDDKEVKKEQNKGLNQSKEN